MSAVLHLDARVSGEAAARLAPTPKTPANGGHGDVRKGIVPVVKPAPGLTRMTWEGGEYKTLSAWLEGPERGGGVILQATDDPLALAETIDRAALIAIDFAKLNDGRGYSTATLLRQRLGYRGSLRATGAITADQIFALARVGFDSFELRDDQDPEVAARALRTFTVAYSSTVAGAGAIASNIAAESDARIALLERTLSRIASRHQNVALASSLSAEDMVITDAIARLKLPITVFTLDTGRLHEETLALIGDVKARYGFDLEVYRPDKAEVAAYIAAHGRDGFYDGVAQRKLCCAIRKVAPLERALKGRGAWVTGQRRDQAMSRADLREREFDAEREIPKFNPLAAWNWNDVLDYAGRFEIPMNALYARGYVSIGCEPCTKAIRPGEDPRTGRWWWENQDSKECGLHTTPTTAL
ncbi:MAG: phosphoadenylyl-sulfate reductase [Terricaulis sp.]